MSTDTDDPRISRAQARAARALLGWSQEELAKRSATSSPTIKRLALGTGPLRPENMTKIRQAFEAAGVEFIADWQPNARGGQGGEGVRFKAPSVPSEATTHGTVHERLIAIGELVHKASKVVEAHPDDPRAREAWQALHLQMGDLAAVMKKTRPA